MVGALLSEVLEPYLQPFLSLGAQYDYFIEEY